MRKNYSFFKSITKFSYYLSDKIVKIVKKLYIFFIFVLIFFYDGNDIIKCFRSNIYIIEIVNCIIKFLCYDYR